MRLLGHEDGAHAAFPDLLQQLVRADHRARTFGRSRDVAGGWVRAAVVPKGADVAVGWVRAAVVPKGADVAVGGEQYFNPAAQLRLAGARLIEKRFPLLRGVLLHGF